jgi:L-amino acid N-acyltransferase
MPSAIWKYSPKTIRIAKRAVNARIKPLQQNRMKTKAGWKQAPKIPSARVILRPAARSDLTAINEIYNHYVLHSTCTYQEEPESIAGRREWFDHHGAEHPVVVAEVNGEVIGWSSLSAYHARSAYRRTVENSVYVHHQHHRRGIGSLLLKDLIARARALGHHAIIAGIDASQAASVTLHERFRFEKVGHFRQVGFKFGRWLDVIYMELLL